jgi:hypothetical protein
MASDLVPIGVLVSFGSADTSGSPASTAGRINFNTAAPISQAPLSTPAITTRKSGATFELSPGLLYGAPTYGMQSAPFVDPQVKARYLLLTADGLSSAATSAALQTQLNAIYLAMSTTYTYNPSTDNIAGAGQQWGRLVIQDGSGVNQMAYAKLIEVVPNLKAGFPQECFVDLTWALLGGFSLATGPAVYGRAIYGVSTYS